MGRRISETFFKPPRQSSPVDLPHKRCRYPSPEQSTSSGDAYLSDETHIDPMVARSTTPQMSAALSASPTPPRPGADTPVEARLSAPAPTRPVAGSKDKPNVTAVHHRLLAELYAHALATGGSRIHLPAGAAPRSSILRGPMHEYVVSATQGMGTAGKFRLAVHIQTGQLLAIKEWRSEDAPTDPEGDDKKTEVSDRSTIYGELDASSLTIGTLHPHEVIDVQGKLYGVMQLMDGDVLALSGARLSAAERAALGRQMVVHVTRDLAHLHAHRRVHCDIKPDNIFWSRDGGFHLGDYGIVEALDHTGSFHISGGTPGFYAPEYYEKSLFATTAADMWSLGRAYAELMLPDQDPFNLHDWEQGVQSSAYQRVSQYFTWRTSILDTHGAASEAAIRASKGRFSGYFNRLMDLDATMCLLLVTKCYAPQNERDSARSLNASTVQVIASEGSNDSLLCREVFQRVAESNADRQEEIARLQIHRRVHLGG